MANRQQIRAFLYRVAAEAAYRAQVQTEPLSTLTAAGFTVTEQDIPEGGISLPTNAQIDAILSSLDSTTEKVETIFWHFLDR